MAMCLISLNDFPRSLDCYQNARIMRAVRYALLRDQADYNIAYLYYFRGEYSGRSKCSSPRGAPAK